MMGDGNPSKHTQTMPVSMADMGTQTTGITLAQNKDERRLLKTMLLKERLTRKDICIRGDAQTQTIIQGIEEISTQTDKVIKVISASNMY